MHFNCRAIIERDVPGGKEILVQERNKPYEGQTRMELPGGRVEEFESLINTLRREVQEETGLELTNIEGQEGRIETHGTDTNVECLQPFAAYQTLQGPVDSLGLYFLCRAEGELLEAGDETRDLRWVSISKIARVMREAPEQISFVDRAGLNFYLSRKAGT
jgi:8-oxo-dGTP diphosphatase